MPKPLTLEPQDIRKEWDRIKDGLVEIKAEYPELSTWRVEDVYASVIAERSVLYIVEDGFAICSLDVDEYSGKTDFYIWIAYSFKPKGNMIKKYLPSFIEVAKNLGCVAVTTVSNHPALAKILEPEYVKYRVPVDV